MKLRHLAYIPFILLSLSSPLFGLVKAHTVKPKAKVSLEANTLLAEWKQAKSMAASSYKTAQAKLSKIPNIRLSAKVPGLGAIAASFDTRRNKTWRSYFRQNNQHSEDKSPLLLLRGKVRLAGARKRSLPIAAALIQTDQGDYLRVNFAARKNQHSGFMRFYELEFKPKRGTNYYLASAKIVPSTSLTGKTCATDKLSKPQNLVAHTVSLGAPHQALAASYVPSVSAATLRVIEISTEADYEYYQTYGSSSNSQIAAVMNSAETIYENELSLTYSLIHQEVITSSSDNYPSSDSETLLYDFRGYTNANHQLGTADVYHLFSGKDLASSVIGLAFTGVICDAPTYAYGLSQHTNSAIDYVTFAHELGHNLNASHDSSLPASIMYPAAGPDQTSFSSFSRSEISSFVSTYGSCLSSTQSSSPTPTPNPSGTAVPTATPTSGGGGSGGGGSGTDPGEDPNLPDLSLSGTLSKSGLFSGTLSLSGNAGSSSCDVSLMIARGTSFSSSYQIALSSGNISSATLQISIPFAVKAIKAKENLTVSMKGLYFCPDSSNGSLSNALKLKPVKVTAKKKLTKSAWIKKFVALARQAVTQSSHRR